jgi:gamma-glutamyl:cysteine ligase YbdK (ATP-grasp superfamily)
VRHPVTYQTLEVIGPEHEFSLVTPQLKPLPISDQIIKAYTGKIQNFVELSQFSFGKEMQLHVMEIKANTPFQSPVDFEQTIQNAVSTLEGIVEKHGASLLGTGMHPLMSLNETGIWPHYHKKIYGEMGKIFNLHQHGWLNIQSFHLNLPFKNEAEGVLLHNLIVNLIAYLPALAASSPIFEGKEGVDVDNRLRFYEVNQKEIPTITEGVIPNYVSSFKQYKQDVIGGYSTDLARVGAGKTILGREWINSRGVIFRFDRSALEIRVMDEQECIKSDVALSCFVRAALRGLMAGEPEFLPRDLLLKDLNGVVKAGLNAQVSNPNGKTARQVCQYYLRVAEQNATEEEKRYLWLIKRRIDEGALSDLIRTRVTAKAQRADFREAVRSVYSTLISCLRNNEPYL